MNRFGDSPVEEVSVNRFGDAPESVSRTPNRFGDMQEGAEPVGTFEGIGGSFRRGMLSLGQGLDASAIQSEREGMARSEAELPRLRAEIEQELARPAGNYLDDFQRQTELAKLRTLERANLTNLERAPKQISKAVVDLSDKETRKQAQPVSEAFRRYSEDPNWVAAFVRDPVEISANLVAESLGPSIPAIAGAVAGMALGGPPGMVAGAGAGSFATERSATLLDALASDYGVDLTDPEQVRAAFANPEIMDAALAKANLAGGIVGAADAATAGFAGRLIPGKGSLGRKLAGYAADQTAQATVEGGAEAVKQYATEGEISGREVFSEMVGGRAADSVETGLAVRNEAKRASVESRIERIKAELEALAPEVAGEPAPKRQSLSEEPMDFEGESFAGATEVQPDADPFEEALSPDAKARIRDEALAEIEQIRARHKSRIEQIKAEQEVETARKREIQPEQIAEQKFFISKNDEIRDFVSKQVAAEKPEAPQPSEPRVDYDPDEMARQDEAADADVDQRRFDDEDVPFARRRSTTQGQPQPTANHPDLERANRQLSKQGGRTVSLREAEPDSPALRSVRDEASKLGLNLRYFRTQDAAKGPFSGFYDPNSGNVWVDAGAGPQEVVQAVLDHEWTHELERSDPDAYNRLADFFQRNAPEASEAAWLRYAQDAAEGGAPVSEDLRRSEGTARLAELVSKPARGAAPERHWLEIAAREPTLLDKTIDAVSAVLGRMPGRTQAIREQSEIAKATLGFRRMLQRAKGQARETARGETEIRYSRTPARKAELQSQYDDLTRQIDAIEAKGENATHAELSKMRGLLGQRSEIRTELAYGNFEADAPATPAPPETPSDEIDRITDRGIMRTGTATYEREPFFSRLKDALSATFLKGWRRFPELTEDTKWQRFKEAIGDLERSGEIIREEVNRSLEHIVEPINRSREDIGADAEAAYEKLARKLRDAEAKGDASPEDRARLTELYNKLLDRPYQLFKQLVIFKDLQARASMVNPRTGKPIAMPNGLTAERIDAQLAQLVARLNRSKDKARIKESLKRHYDAMERERQLMKEFGYEIPPEQNNPYYYPHKVLEYFSARLPAPKFLTDKPFRGYLEELVGTSKDIESDYLAAVYSHMYDVRMHNAQQRAFEEGLKPYDKADEILARLQADADEDAEILNRRPRKLTRNSIKDSDIPEGYVRMKLDLKTPMRMADVLDREALGKQLGIEIAKDEPLMRQLSRMGVKAQLTAEILEAAFVASPYRTLIVPAEIAEATRGMIRRQDRQPGLVSRTTRGFNQLWKYAKLFLPWNYIRYEYGNTLTDLEKGLSGDPRTYSLIPQAHAEVVEFLKTGKGPERVRQAFRNGVFDTVTQQEIEALPQLKAFRNFEPSGKRMRSQLSAMLKATAKVSRYREALFRYAKFLSALEAYENGAYPKYQGAYSKEVEAMGDSREGANDAVYRKAAKISRETYGDYGAIGVNGDMLRQHIIPFYSWLEINFRYHRNILRNYRDLMMEGRFAQANGVAAHGAAMAAGFIARLALPIVAIQIWNNTGDRDELEKTLSEEDRRRLHLVLGKDADGKTLVMYQPTALGDIMEWFGGNDAARLAGEMSRGEKTLPQAVEEWGAGYPKDLLNKAIGSIGPVAKIPYTALARKRIFPDATDQRSIPGYELVPAVLEQMTDQFAVDMIRRVADKDYYAAKDMGDWAQQLILQQRKRDPEAWAYYSIRDKAEAFLESKGRAYEPGVNNSEDAAKVRGFRRAIYAGDLDQAMKFYGQLVEVGYSAEQMRSSVRAQDPLASVPKKDGLRREFVSGLSEWENEQLGLAYRHYAKMQAAKGSERALFPPNRVPKEFRSEFEPRMEVLRRVIERSAGERDEREMERMLAEALANR